MTSKSKNQHPEKQTKRSPSPARVIDAADTAAKGDFLAIPAFICKIPQTEKSH